MQIFCLSCSFGSRCCDVCQQRRYFGNFHQSVPSIQRKSAHKKKQGVKSDAGLARTHSSSFAESAPVSMTTQRNPSFTIPTFLRTSVKHDPFGSNVKLFPLTSCNPRPQRQGNRGGEHKRDQPCASRKISSSKASKKSSRILNPPPPTPQLLWVCYYINRAATLWGNEVGRKRPSFSP